MSEKALPRPPQVTLLGGAILAGSVLVVLLAFDQMASLGSVETQEAAESFVTDGSGRALGISADQWQTVLRVMLLVAGGTAVVTSFLGWQVLQRVRSARVVLSILAPVMLLTGTATDNLVATVVVVAIALLWRQPARDWFNGITPARRDAAASVAAPVQPQAQPQAQPQLQSQPAPPTYAAPQPGQGWPPPPPSSNPARPTSLREVPGSVRAAVVTTIVTSVVSLATIVLILMMIGQNRSDFESEMASEIARQPAYEDLDLDPSVIADVAVAALIALALWSLAAIVLAVLTARGSNAARITLAVSAIVAGLTALLGVLLVVPLLVAGACVTVAVLLLRGEAATWFAARRRS